ncbi:LVIVD repeat-containing protein [Aeromicrobium sp.]|uniref:LVIVD repeat-containing protein n=1 Tax=Aeromicrobium sp. TaxID=1871063 RepID=UPI003D6A519B
MTIAAVAAAASAALLLPTTAHAHDDGGDEPSATRELQVADSGAGTEMSPVANLQYDDTGAAQAGSDIEFLKVGRREYALAGTLRKGLQIVDITDPTAPRIAAVYDCQISQGDIQVWKNGTRILASYTADGTFGTAGASSQCAKDLGLDANSSGTVIVDLTDPTAPKSVSFASVPRGSHNMTIHPSGKYLYNSNSDLITSTSPTITIYDVSVPESPRKVQDFPIPFVPASLGSESHDITFNEAGTRAYSAALSQTLVLDTTSPEQPKIVGEIVDPSINVSHGSDPITLTRADGTQRDVLVVTDERAGAAGSAECPGGGLHVYDVTGSNERDPKKLGTWFIPVVQPQAGTRCTSHVLRIYPDQEMLTIGWYGQGVRVLDISGLADVQGSPTTVAIGDGVGMREVGNYVFPDGDTWSFKTNRIAADGSFYGYGNDLTRGFDVYRFSGAGLSVPPLEPTDMRSRGGGKDRPRGPVPAEGAVALLATPFLAAAAVSLRRRFR